MRYSITSVALPSLSLEQTFDLVGRLGYDGVELRVRRIPPAAVGGPFSFWGNHRNDLSPDNFVALAPRIRSLAEERGIAIPAVASNATASELDDVRRLAEGAALVGCPLVRVGAPQRYDGSVPYRDVFEEAVEAFARAVDVVSSFGVRALLEIHGGTITVSAGLALRLVERFPAEKIGVVYDVQNMVREGYEGIRLGPDVLGPYLAHVHIGGHAPHSGEREPDGTLAWAWSATELADGLLSTSALLRELRRASYGGFITVEDLRPEVEPEAKFRAAIRYLRGLEA